MRELLNRIRSERTCRHDILGLGGCSLDELWRLPSDAELAGIAVEQAGHAVLARAVPVAAVLAVGEQAEGEDTEDATHTVHGDGYYLAPDGQANIH